MVHGEDERKLRLIDDEYQVVAEREQAVRVLPYFLIKLFLSLCWGDIRNAERIRVKVRVQIRVEG